MLMIRQMPTRESGEVGESNTISELGAVNRPLEEPTSPAVVYNLRATLLTTSQLAAISSLLEIGGIFVNRRGCRLPEQPNILTYA